MAKRRKPSLPAVISAESQPPVEQALGGALEGASKISRDIGMWRPPIISPDRQINRDKPILDARGRDLIQNSGLMAGALATHRDSIVGSQFVLNAQPAFKTLGLDETWAEEFQEEVEEKFTLVAESPDCWFDASRTDTLTGLVRLAVGVAVFGGEVLATVEWLRAGNRPFNTAVLMIDTDRLSNPYDADDTATLRRGVERDRYGAPVAYHIREGHPTDWHLDSRGFTWKRVPVRAWWGRQQVIHIYERMRPDQSRGVAEMVAALKEMKMTKQFSEITLQNAIVNATYAATIESELPREAAFEQMGAGDSSTWAENYMAKIAEYIGGGANIAIDGVKIPHLFPGTKLNLRPAGTPGGVGTDFEKSLLRHVAASLGLSYEQFSKDYTETNYSSARASMVETWKYMQARKKMVADRFASHIYALWLEEMLSKRLITAMPRNAPSFYEPMMKEAYTACSWIGAARGQIDELKETQASALRMDRHLSTLEAEVAAHGKDWRKVLRQQAREKKLRKELGLDEPPQGAPSKPGTLAGGDRRSGTGQQDGNDNNGEANADE